jgi:hypothetical protein
MANNAESADCVPSGKLSRMWIGVRPRLAIPASEQGRAGPAFGSIERAFSIAIWWSRSGSNRLPPQCDCGALPDELRPRTMGRLPIVAPGTAPEQRDRGGRNVPEFRVRTSPKSRKPAPGCVDGAGSGGRFQQALTSLPYGACLARPARRSCGLDRAPACRHRTQRLHPCLGHFAGKR